MAQTNIENSKRCYNSKNAFVGGLAGIIPFSLLKITYLLFWHRKTKAIQFNTIPPQPAGVREFPKSSSSA